MAGGDETEIKNFKVFSSYFVIKTKGRFPDGRRPFCQCEERLVKEGLHPAGEKDMLQIAEFYIQNLFRYI